MAFWVCYRFSLYGPVLLGNMVAMMPFMQTNFFVITGCSGGGKSSLLAALAKQGFSCVEESGRSIVRQQKTIGGTALPGLDDGLLGELILSHNLHHFERMAQPPSCTTRPVFFDRGIPEALSNDHLLGKAPLPHHVEAARLYRYNPLVFIAPPWPEIFVHDAERQHGFAASLREYTMLCKVYPQCGYRLLELPKTDVASRVAFVRAHVVDC